MKLTDIKKILVDARLPIFCKMIKLYNVKRFTIPTFKKIMWNKTSYSSPKVHQKYSFLNVISIRELNLIVAVDLNESTNKHNDNKIIFA